MCGVDLELKLGCVLGEVRCEKKVGVEVMLLVSGMVGNGGAVNLWEGVWSVSWVVTSMVRHEVDTFLMFVWFGM